MKNIKFLILIMATSLSVTSCLLDDEERTFDEGPNVLMFPSAEATGFFLNDNADDYTYNVPLRITGGNGLPLSANVNANFEIDPASTATEGVEFDLANSNSSVLINAGDSFTNIPIIVHSGALDPENPAKLILNITSGSASGYNIVASGSRGQITITLQATCSSDLAGTYALTVTNSSGGGNSYPMEVITEIGPGEYLTTQTGTWNPGVLIASGATVEGFVFKEVCGSIVIEQQNLANGTFSNLVEGTDVLGTVDQTTGDITLEYTIGFSNNTTFTTYNATYIKL